MASKTTRIYRSDEEKRKLIEEFNQIPQRERRQWLDQHKLTSSWFYRFRKNMGLDAQDEAPRTVRQFKSTTTRHGWPSDPAERSKEMKRRQALVKQKREAGILASPDSFTPAQKRSLVEQYNAQPLGDRMAWLAKYKIAQTTMDYWRKHPSMRKSKTTSKGNVADTYGPQVAAAFNAYKALPQREKASWREEHRVSPAQLNQIRKGIATIPIASRTLNHQPSQAQALIRALDAPPIHLVPQAVPVTTQVTLEDAVISFEVKRNHLNEFIEELKLMMRGGRK